MKVETLKQFSVFLPNKPGALSRLAGLFARKGINIVGMASEVRDDSGVVRLAVSNEREAAAVLSSAGLASVETAILSVEVQDRPGELERLTKALADGRVNITTVYGTALGGQVCRILIASESTEKARKILEGL